MTELINILLLVPLVSILLYIIPMCYLDAKYREVNHWYWLPIILVNVPVTAYLYVEGWYPWYAFVISLIICGIFLVVMRLGLLNGADFLFLAFVALFWIVNPHPFPHGIQAQFYIYLIVSMLVTAGMILAINYMKGERKGLVAMMQDYPGGVPYMLTISLAFILSWRLG